MFALGFIPGGKLGMKIVGGSMSKNQRSLYPMFNKNGTISEFGISRSEVITKSRLIKNKNIPSGYSKYKMEYSIEGVNKRVQTHFYRNKKGKIFYDLDYKTKLPSDYYK